jgi:hypothetical protein
MLPNFLQLCLLPVFMYCAARQARLRGPCQARHRLQEAPAHRAQRDNATWRQAPHPEDAAGEARMQYRLRLITQILRLAAVI